MSLSYFTIFNPSLGPDEETLPKQLLFYTSAVVSDLDSQLRNIGLVQGIVELGRSFSEDAQPVTFVKSKDTRSHLLEVDAGYWIVLCLDVVTEEGKYVKDLPLNEQVLVQIRVAYKLFVLEHGTFESLLQKERESALKVIESWWMHWAWSWNPSGEDAVLLFEGYSQARTPLTESQLNKLVGFKSRLSALYPETFYELLVFENDDYLDSGVLLSVEHKQVLQYLLCQPGSKAPLGTEQAADVSQSNQKMPTADPDLTTQDSWLSGQKWSKETTRMLSTLSMFKKLKMTTDASEQGDSKAESLQYHWQYIEDKRVLLNSDVSRPKYFNILRHRDFAFVSLLSDPGERERALVRENIETTIPQFVASLDRPATNPATTSESASSFFSLVHNIETGSIVSTLPSHASALRVTSEESTLQIAVKTNTLHLHRQIYLLLTAKMTQCCIKTFKNIWIIIKRDRLGTVVLARSGKPGETMEEIESAAARYMDSVRTT